MRTTAVNTRLAVVLEGQRQTRPELHDLAVLDADVQLLDLGDAQVAQGARRRVDRIARRVFPRVGAGADDLGDAIDGAAAFLSHGPHSSRSRESPARPFYTRRLGVAMHSPVAGMAVTPGFHEQGLAERHLDRPVQIRTKYAHARLFVARQDFARRVAEAVAVARGHDGPARRHRGNELLARRGAAA